MAIEAVVEEAAVQGSGVRTDDAEKSELGPVTVAGTGIAGPAKMARGMLEARMEAALASLAAPSGPASATVRQAHSGAVEARVLQARGAADGGDFLSGCGGAMADQSYPAWVGRVFVSPIKQPASVS